MSQKQQPTQYTNHGVDVYCPICKNDKFTSGRAQLNTALATFFKFDWANKEVQTLTCSKCKYILGLMMKKTYPSNSSVWAERPLVVGAVSSTSITERGELSVKSYSHIS